MKMQIANFKMQIEKEKDKTWKVKLQILECKMKRRKDKKTGSLMQIANFKMQIGKEKDKTWKVKLQILECKMKEKNKNIKSQNAK